MKKMSNKEPTGEQVEKFWKWCGWTLRDVTPPGAVHQYISWFTPDGKETEYGSENPCVDLNSLFKWAVPKLRELGWMCRVQYSPLRDPETFTLITDWTGYASLFWVKVGEVAKGWEALSYPAVIHKDPALALFWAIWELIEQGKEVIIEA